MSEFLTFKSRLQLGLMLAGGIAGAIAGCALTVFGKIIAGAPPATLADYVWNMAQCGVLAAVISPLVTWSALRRAPLWRTVVEPLAAGIAGAAAGVLLGSAAVFLLLTPLGMAAAMLRLGHRYREQPLLRHAPRRIEHGANG